VAENNMHPVDSTARYGFGLVVAAILIAIWSGHGYGAGQRVADFADGVGQFFAGVGNVQQDLGVGEGDGPSPTPAIPLNRDGTIATPREVFGQ
jgi:hypothetical protein